MKTATKIAKSAKILELRSTEFAIGQVASITMKHEMDPRLSRLLQHSLRYGWLDGYAAAMNDIVAIRAAENEVKH